MNSLRDVVFGLRQFCRHPWMPIAIVVSLGAAMGIGRSLFSIKREEVCGLASAEKSTGWDSVVDVGAAAVILVTTGAAALWPTRRALSIARSER